MFRPADQDSSAVPDAQFSIVFGEEKKPSLSDNIGSGPSTQGMFKTEDPTEFILIAIKKGFDAKEAYDEYLADFPRTSTQADVTKAIHQSPPPGQICLLNTFLRGLPGELGEFFNLLFDRVVTRHEPEIMRHFAGIAQLRIKDAVDRGLTAEDPVEKIEMMVLGETAEDIRINRVALLMTYFSGPELPVLDEVLRPQIKKVQEEKKHNSSNEIIARYLEKETAQSNLTSQKALTKLFHPQYALMTANDVQVVIRQVPADKYPVEHAFLSCFLNQLKYKTFNEFFNSVYFPKLAEQDLKKVLISDAGEHKTEQYFRRCIFGILIDPSLGKQGFKNSMAQMPRSASNYVNAFLYSDCETLGEFFSSLFKTVKTTLAITSTPTPPTYRPGV